VKVEIAKYAGVCYGVERALKMANEAAGAGGAVHTLGPLIHNPHAGHPHTRCRSRHDRGRGREGAACGRRDVPVREHRASGGRAP
jgi:hypothetical protein